METLSSENESGFRGTEGAPLRRRPRMEGVHAAAGGEAERCGCPGRRSGAAPCKRVRAVRFQHTVGRIAAGIDGAGDAERPRRGPKGDGDSRAARPAAPSACRPSSGREEGGGARCRAQGQGSGLQAPQVRRAPLRRSRCSPPCVLQGAPPAQPARALAARPAGGERPRDAGGPCASPPAAANCASRAAAACLEYGMAPFPGISDARSAGGPGAHAKIPKRRFRCVMAAARPSSAKSAEREF